MNFLIPKDWSDFQHYKDRAPAWIKLHGGLLDDYEFHCLPLASKALAPMLWLLASKYEDGRIPLDHDKIAFRLRLSVSDVQDAIKPLIDAGFFRVEQEASKPLAECLPREREEKEEEKEEDVPAARTRKKNPETLLPNDFEVTQRVKTWAAEKQFTDRRVAENFAKFVLWAKAKGAKYCDWDAALMTAIREDWAKVGDAKAESSSAPSGTYRKYVPS